MNRLIKLFSFTIAMFLASATSWSQVISVKQIGITVSDMDRSVAFYHDVLGFKKISDREWSGEKAETLQGLFGVRIRIVRMQLGDEMIELSDYLTPGGRSIPEDMKSNDLYFQHIAIVVSNMEKAYAHLKKHMVMRVSTEPQTIPVSNVAAAGIKAFYFQDPDHHDLELIFFPKGKGLAKWQNANGKLFLGIDHTAIGISNTDKSLAFYSQLLGLERKGDSWNKGMEQAHLNNIENASLHITGLRTNSGPGIEFLEYLQPGPGRKYPADSRCDDLWHWQTTVTVHHASDLYDRLRKEGFVILSKSIVELDEPKRRPIMAFIVRDPDGHALLIKDGIDRP